MEIHKFGGASVKDIESVQNVHRLVVNHLPKESLLVVSAMDKTTNALEKVVGAYQENKEELPMALEEVKNFHLAIIDGLFDTPETKASTGFDALFSELTYFLNHTISKDYNFIYDQVVCYGELFSTKILTAYLQNKGVDCQWLDARKLIKTNTTYREGLVNWEQTKKTITQTVDSSTFFITQGFIGSAPDQSSTTLGREGSDYSAAIFAYCLDADCVTIWKDVPGVLNADPNVFEDTQLLEQISYHEAIEMAFFGASVIHPKTLQPLQNKEIPLFVKSFKNPEALGTKVSRGAAIVPKVPCFIVKKNQVLISFFSKDFSFILEHQVSEIFRVFAKYHIKVQVIQNSAISFSVCVEDKYNHFDEVLAQLNDHFRISYNTHLTLYTIRHFSEKDAQKIKENKEVLLQQINRDTIQILTK